MNKMSVRIRRMLLLLMVSTLLLAGCNAGSTAKDEQERQTLKVMFSDESYFYQLYGDLFSMRYPNVDIEVVSMRSMYSEEITDYKKAYKDFIDQEQPDVVVLDTISYKEFVTDGQLLELDSLISKDQYDIETIYPGMIEVLKENGGGKLYGLVPSFYGNAIYYNADLFAKYGIEVPHDGMTWQELLETARKFPTDGDKDTRVYGFGEQHGSVNLDGLVSRISSTLGLQFINPDTMKITLNTDSWKEAYKLAIEAMDSGAIYNPEDGGFQGGTMQEYYESQPFMMGRMAMMVGGPYTLSNIRDAKSAIKDYTPFEIGVAAGPVDPANPDQTRSVYLNNILSIRSGSPNAEAAWEFLKFVNGEEYAKIKSRTMSDGLLTRMGMMTEFDGVSLEPFYKLKPVIDTGAENLDKIPNDFYQQYYPIMSREVELIENRSKSVDEALQTIEEESQALLDKLVLEQADKQQDEAENSSIQE